MSIDDEQLKAKIGQILYNNYITDRLREEVLQRIAHRNNLSLRMSLGKDSTGEEIFLDVLVNRARPEVEKLKRAVRTEGVRAGELRKYTCIVLVSDSSDQTDNVNIATNFEYLMSQSLNWWARYSGARDSLNVERWRIDGAITIDSRSLYTTVELPIESIIIPDSRFRAPEGLVDSLLPLVDVLPPVGVRVRDKNRFDLLYGYPVILAYSRAGKREIPATVRTVTDDEAERLWEKDHKAWEKWAKLTLPSH
jgi:hypothetical protein